MVCSIIKRHVNLYTGIHRGVWIKYFFHFLEQSVYILTVLQLAVHIACAYFALPYVSLSNPDAGLRLREDPIADRADGLLAALEVMRPQGFGSGIVGSSIHQKVTFICADTPGAPEHRPRYEQQSNRHSHWSVPFTLFVDPRSTCRH